MTKKQIIYCAVCALIAAAVFDFGFFLVQEGPGLTPAPADFNGRDSSNTFVVAHYQFNWIKYLIEVAVILALITAILALLKRTWDKF